jgi:hypothetical protein
VLRIGTKGGIVSQANSIGAIQCSNIPEDALFFSAVATRRLGLGTCLRRGWTIRLVVHPETPLPGRQTFRDFRRS